MVVRKDTSGGVSEAWTSADCQLGVTANIDQLKSVDRAHSDVFIDGIGQIPNNPITAATLAAILHGGPNARQLLGGWNVDDLGRLVFRHLGKRGGEIVIYPQLDGGKSSLEDQWTFVKSLSTLTVDVLFITLAQLCEPGMLQKTSYPHSQTVTMSSRAIMKYKNMVRWGADGHAFQDRIAEEIRTLRQLRFDIIDFPAWDAKTRKWNSYGISITGDRIIDVAQSIHMGQDERDQAASQHYWHIRFGQWGTSWVNRQGKIWLGPLPRLMIDLDHRRSRGSQVLAKKLGIATVLLWGALRNHDRIDRRIGALLESIGELPDASGRSTHWAGRMFDRFTDASLLLREQDLLNISYEGGEYLPEELGRAKGWSKVWLDSKITIERPSCFK